MDSVLMITISTLVLAIILIVITIAVIKGKQSKKYKKEIEELDIEKNSLLGVPVLSEITKVKELIKTDNLKEKLNDWDNTFKYIRDEKIPELTDSISDADFLIDRKCRAADHLCGAGTSGARDSDRRHDHDGRRGAGGDSGAV